MSKGIGKMRISEGKIWKSIGYLSIRLDLGLFVSLGVSLDAPNMASDLFYISNYFSDSNMVDI